MENRRVRRRGLLQSVLLALPVAGPHPARADTFPSRPIRLLVGFPAAGGTDLVARLLAERMGAVLGQSVVVENRPGASGTIAASAVAHASPDGYTLFFATSGHAGNGALYSNLNYHTVRDFSTVGIAGHSSLLVMVGANSKYGSLKDLVQAARDNPGRLNYAAAGGGATLTNLAFEAMKQRLGIRVTSIPYKGSAPAQMAVMSGEVDFTFDTISGGSALVKSGKTRALAVTSAARSQALPNVPTIAEELIPGFDFVGWYGLLAPAKTPDDVIARLNAGLRQVVGMPSVRARMLELGAEPGISTPAEFAAVLARDTEQSEATIRGLGIRIE